MQRFVHGLSILVHWSVCLSLLPVPHCFDYYSFAVSFEIRNCEPSSCVLFSQDYFGFQDSCDFCFIKMAAMFGCLDVHNQYTFI